MGKEGEGGRVEGNAKEEGRRQQRTKITVKNLPFQATRTDLLSLFGPYGSVLSLKVPKKYGGSSSGHRGFAFVEFGTGREATRAMDGLGRTHLYGRRLVLEWEGGGKGKE